MTKIQLLSRSPADTRALAARLGARLAPGDTVALRGELGAGKTEFVRGLAQGLGVPGEVVASPSFALAYEYQGRLTLVHLDLYRLAEVPLEFFPDLEDYLSGPQVTAVEWAERLGNLLPSDYLEVLLVITGEEERRISLTGHGLRGEELLLSVREKAGADNSAQQNNPEEPTAMARKKPQFRGPKEPQELFGAAQNALDYVKPYLKWLLVAGVSLAVVLLVWGGIGYVRHSREVKAQAALEKARPELSQPGQAEAVIKTLTTLIQDYPSTQAAQVARVFKAHLFYQTKKYADAAKLYEELRSSSGTDPYAWSPFVTESLSYCYESQGDFAKAAQTLKPLVDQARGSYQTLLLSHLALLYDKAGEHKAAEDTWQRLLTQSQNPLLVSYWKERLAQDKTAPSSTTGKK